MVSGEFREKVEQGGMDRTREALAHQTLTHGIRLTSMAWDAIQSADLDELAFLYRAACVDTTTWEVHHVVRALLETAALRRA